MTEKITLSVYIVGISRTCDFLVPSNMSVRNAVKLMKKIVFEEYWGNVPVSDKKLSLIKRSDAMLLNEAMSFSQLGISNGEQLVLAQGGG